MQRRKDEHLRICLDLPAAEVEYSDLTTGFERYILQHCALPDFDLSDVDLTTDFLGRKLDMPLMIAGMTGGTAEGYRINRNLAIAAGRLGIMMGVGSQRVAIEDPSVACTFKVKSSALDVPLVANLGASYLAHSGDPVGMAKSAVEMIQADFLAIHLNPIQEALQPEGDPAFHGALGATALICGSLHVPVIAKEVGFGISGRVANMLKDTGVAAIDVAGAGGTSWARIEGIRASGAKQRLAEEFADWGIPTSKSLEECHAAVPDLPLISSGGIRSGMDVAKSLAIGAEIAAAGLPLLRAAAESADAVEAWCVRFANELRLAMFGVGARTIAELRIKKPIRRFSPEPDR